MTSGERTTDVRSGHRHAGASGESGDLSSGTRLSLLGRLADPGDDRSWREFEALYSRLILNVARRAGLGDAEAREALQETLISVARKMPEFRYEPGRDSFKGWLLHLARYRIADQFRLRGRARGGWFPAGEEGSCPPGRMERGAEPACPPELEALWDAEWQEAITAAALERVRTRVRPEHFEIFHLAVVRQQAPRDVARALGVGIPRVYLVKHRVTRALREAVREVRAEWLSD